MFPSEVLADVVGVSYGAPASASPGSSSPCHMPLEASLDRVHRRATSNAYLRLFAATIRGLLAVGFIVPGLTKLQGRFTLLPVSTPVGFFLEAFYRARSFYLFVGVAQILAGVMLLMPLTTTLGAVVYFPIILCIFLINIAVGFSGTYVVTGLMMLGTLYLLCWDYDRWKSLLPGFGASAHRDVTRHLGTRATLIAGFLAGLLGLGAASLTTSLVDHAPLARPLALLAVATALCTASVEWYRRTVRDGPASDHRSG